MGLTTEHVRFWNGLDRVIRGDGALIEAVGQEGTSWPTRLACGRRLASLVSLETVLAADDLWHGPIAALHCQVVTLQHQLVACLVVRLYKVMIVPRQTL